MKKIVISGGAGFVGSHLSKKLLNEGNHIICIDNLITGNIENIANLRENENFHFIEHDIENPIVLEGIHEIYNLACPASPKAYQKDPIKTLRTSILGAINMLELAKQNNAKILQASTSEVYGDPLENPQNEKYFGNVNPCGIRGCYDEGKRAAETLFMDYHRIYNIQVRIIRIFNTYGPNMAIDDGRVVSNFINQALNNEDITIYGSGEQTRSFQFVDDLIRGMICMMDNDIGFVGPVNIGTDFEFTIKELSELILKLIPDSKSKIIYEDLPGDDPKQRRADNLLAKEKLGREPKILLEEGLEKTIRYFKDFILL